MADKKSAAQLEEYFQTGDIPTQSNFEELINSSLNLVDARVDVDSSSITFKNRTVLRATMVEGALDVKNSHIDIDSSTGNLDVKSGKLKGQGLEISGSSTLKEVRVEGESTLNGKAVFNNEVKLTGKVDIDGDLTSTGDVTVSGGTLSASGHVTLGPDSNIQITGEGDNSEFVINGDLKALSDINLGDTTLKSADVINNLTVSNNLSASGSVELGKTHNNNAVINAETVDQPGNKSGKSTVTIKGDVDISDPESKSRSKTNVQELIIDGDLTVKRSDLGGNSDVEKIISATHEGVILGSAECPSTVQGDFTALGSTILGIDPKNIPDSTKNETITDKKDLVKDTAVWGKLQAKNKVELGSPEAKGTNDYSTDVKGHLNVDGDAEIKNSLTVKKGLTAGGGVVYLGGLSATAAEEDTFKTEALGEFHAGRKVFLGPAESHLYIYGNKDETDKRIEVTGKFNATGPVTLGGDTEVDDVTTVKGEFIAEKKVTLGRTPDSSISGDKGDATNIMGPFKANGDFSLGHGGDNKISNEIDKDANDGSRLIKVSGKLVAKGNVVLGTAESNTVSVKGSMDVDNALTVEGLAQFNNGVTVSKTDGNIVTEVISVSDRVSVSGEIDLKNNIYLGKKVGSGKEVDEATLYLNPGTKDMEAGIKGFTKTVNNDHDSLPTGKAVTKYVKETLSNQKANRTFWPSVDYVITEEYEYDNDSSDSDKMVYRKKDSDPVEEITLHKNDRVLILIPENSNHFNNLYSVVSASDEESLELDKYDEYSDLKDYNQYAEIKIVEPGTSVMVRKGEHKGSLWTVVEDAAGDKQWEKRNDLNKAFTGSNGIEVDHAGTDPVIRGVISTNSTPGVIRKASVNDILDGRVDDAAVTPKGLREYFFHNDNKPAGNSDKKYSMNMEGKDISDLTSFTESSSLKSDFFYSDYATTHKGTKLFVTKAWEDNIVYVYEWRNKSEDVRGKFVSLHEINTGAVYSRPVLVNIGEKTFLYAGQTVWTFSDESLEFIDGTTLLYENNNGDKVNAVTAGNSNCTQFGFAYDGQYRLAILEQIDVAGKVYTIENPAEPHILTAPINFDVLANQRGSYPDGNGGFYSTKPVKNPDNSQVLFSFDGNAEAGLVVMVLNPLDKRVRLLRWNHGDAEFNEVMDLYEVDELTTFMARVEIQSGSVLVSGNDFIPVIGHSDDDFLGIPSYNSEKKYGMFRYNFDARTSLSGAQMPLFAFNGSFYGVVYSENSEEGRVDLLPLHPDMKNYNEGIDGNNFGTGLTEETYPLESEFKHSRCRKITEDTSVGLAVFDDAIVVVASPQAGAISGGQHAVLKYSDNTYNQG